MNPRLPKFAAGTLVNQLRRFRHSSHNSETNYVAVYIFKKWFFTSIKEKFGYPHFYIPVFIGWISLFCQQ